ncbi:MAG: DUF3592 domain-containing protein [Rhodothermaceae bacterium]|nr:DUF3592 domain-containing protein [Bacteroidota bacterium]MXX97443.1 DUF3592 domain-containing protein [Rhodothermaceae bacterium]MXZ58559.1 DUF3592 domain-containing protein [Rhodothermaceae bacterium]MYB91874.1 DUF3592 domain-containing protein [Rhodothermaceae bacterium]MYD68085.1 DUF3592 domain-containing protein [Rhodothermaceae bacterium]
MVRVIARIFWGIPFILVCLAVNQGLVAVQLRETWNQGVPAIAKVKEFDVTNRADVTYGYINLQVTLPDGQTIDRQRMSLPQSLWSRVKGQDSLRVHVRPGASQEIVIDRLMPAHWLIAASQMGISLIGAILSGVLAYFWNRSLRRG